MLSPAQVIPFLDHEDGWVREHAARYVAEAHDCSPCTADDFWRVWDRRGLNNRTLHLYRLRTIPQTPLSLRRTLQALRECPEKDRWHLTDAIQEISYELLCRCWPEIAAARDVLSADDLQVLEARFALRDKPPDALWERLIAHAIESKDLQVGELDHSTSDQLIEALAPHPAAVSERAMDVLRDETIQDWREIFCIKLVGLMKHSPAIDLLLAKLRIDADYMNERVVDALVRIGEPEVVERLAANFAQEPEHYRLYSSGVLGRIKRSESEAAIVRLLPNETDSMNRTALLQSLCDLCPTDPSDLKQLRHVVLDDSYDSLMFDLKETLLAVCTMAGYELPERDSWREEVAPEWERQMKILEDPEAAMEKRFQQLMLSGRDPLELEDEDEPAPAVPGGHYESDETGTVHRAAPKVGRNDPCPCGSGKKYKKCCFGK